MTAYETAFAPAFKLGADTESQLIRTGRKQHGEDTVIEVGSKRFERNELTVIAGPCSIESESQCMEIAAAVKASGAAAFRGGAFKPRTSPYAFRGLGKEGLSILSKVKKEFDIPVISEIMDPRDLPLFDDIDILQIGTRNMQNFALLEEVGKSEKPVLLKRGMGATVDELLLSAEYIMNKGNENVILCERGIRTFEHATRCTLDIAAIPILHSASHLPVFADPSHAAGNRTLVPALACAAVAAGADGLEIEVHNDPDNAASDGPQSLNLNQFANLMAALDSIHSAANRNGARAGYPGCKPFEH